MNKNQLKMNYELSGNELKHNCKLIKSELKLNKKLNTNLLQVMLWVNIQMNEPHDINIHDKLCPPIILRH